MKTAVKGALIASAVASLFACQKPEEKSGDKPASAPSVRCGGVNACQGKGQCGGADAGGAQHGCAGQNSCKGKGWISLSEEECKAKGGTVVADK